MNIKNYKNYLKKQLKLMTSNLEKKIVEEFYIKFPVGALDDMQRAYMRNIAEFWIDRLKRVREEAFRKGYDKAYLVTRDRYRFREKTLIDMAEKQEQKRIINLIRLQERTGYNTYIVNIGRFLKALKYEKKSINKINIR